MSAKETRLGELHEKLAEAYLRALDGDEVTPALLTSIAKFLKDNAIQAEAGDEALTDLKGKLANVLDFPFNAKEA